jgi:hypothetical protein
MPQLNLNFTDIPIPETHLWEQFDDKSKSRSRPWCASSFKRLATNIRSRAMTDLSKIKFSHLQRAAYVYIRESSPGQVEHNRESTARQYALAERAAQLGWTNEQVVLINEDLGLSGSGTDQRSGFARLTSKVAMAHVGIVLGLEVSRLARNNADWYRLLELCGITDTLIGDVDGISHPVLFNDRRAAHHSCPSRWRHPQQGGSRGVAARLAGRSGLGRTGW